MCDPRKEEKMTEALHVVEILFCLSKIAIGELSCNLQRTAGCRLVPLGVPLVRFCVFEVWCGISHGLAMRCVFNLRC